MTRMNSMTFERPWISLRPRPQTPEPRKEDEIERAAALRRAQTHAEALKDAACASFFLEGGRYI